MKIIILFIVTFFFNLSTWAKKLPFLKTKITTSNLRFITSDGKLTYYQRSGKLYMATNYDAKVLFKDTSDANYIVSSSPESKKIIVMRDENFHTYLGTRKEKFIYSLSYAQTQQDLLGTGIAATFQLSGSWVSFYKPLLKIIRLKNLANKAKVFDISLSNTINPYFIPQVVMLDENRVLFTDLNKEGIPGLILFNKSTKSSSLVYKAVSYNSVISVCFDGKNIYTGDFGINDSRSGSQIFSSSIDTIEKFSSIYQSRKNDLGQINCSFHKDKLYFVKKTQSKPTENFEIFTIDKQSKKLEQISNLKNIYHLIVMDKSLLAPHKGKYVLISGQDDLTKVDQLKK